MTCGHTLVAGDMSVSRKVHELFVNQGGTAVRLYVNYPSLTEPKSDSVMGGFILRESNEPQEGACSLLRRLPRSSVAERNWMRESNEPRSAPESDPAQIV